MSLPASDPAAASRRAVVWGLVAGLALWAGLSAWDLFFRQEPQALQSGSDEEFFKYGSIGTEDENGIPYWIWHVLPEVFPEHLPGPGGYASFGFAWEEGRQVPIGFSRRRIGFERININCALCHSATVRRHEEAAPEIHVGGPSHTADPLAYQRFLFACAKDPRFNADDLMAAIARVHEMPWLERLAYRWVLIPRVREALLDLEKDFEWTVSRPAWGPGRIDPFNPVKVSTLRRVAGHERIVSVGDTIGNSDMVPVWNLKLRTQRAMRFHWDGMNDRLEEVVRSSAVGDGAAGRTLPLASLDRVQEYLTRLPAPPFPFPIDPRRAEAGRAVYAREGCARCHDPGGEMTGKVIPVSEAGTDPERARMWSPADAAAYNDYASGYSWDFGGFTSTGGYVCVPLDAIWIRAPYLHNGSVPDLRALLEPPSSRPAVFHRGYDLFDPIRVGFVSQGPQAERAGFRFDTSQPGNSRQGHLWGTQLPELEKLDLIEYLKTQ